MNKQELIQEAKDKLIQVFGNESVLAQAMEDTDCNEKLEEFIAYLLGRFELETMAERPQHGHAEPWPAEPSQPWPTRPKSTPWRTTVGKWVDYTDRTRRATSYSDSVIAKGQAALDAYFRND